VEIGQQVRLLCSWTRHLNGIASIFYGETGSNRWQLDSMIDSMTEKVPSLSPGRGTLTNK